MGFRHGKLWLGASVMGCAALAACDAREQIEENFRDVTSHEAYARSLRQAGLSENRLAVQWNQAAESALMSPLSVASPFEERGVFDPADPRALGFRIEAERLHDLGFDGAVVLSGERLEPGGLTEARRRVVVGRFRR